MRQEGIENIIRKIQSGKTLREELIYYYRSNILEIAMQGFAAENCSGKMMMN
ncbi:MAG: hypothetical protein ACOYVD_11165 [Bacillota bacterium]